MREIAPQPNRFKAEMPRIPGVNETSAVPVILKKAGFRVLVLAAALLVFGGILWRTIHSRVSRTSASADTSEAPPVEAPDLAAVAAPRSNVPVTAATLDELSRPWSAKEFTFVDPVTHQTVPAMIIRLPGAAASSSAAYWAFSLDAPYQRCRLEYIVDLSELKARFAYHASHPMVAGGCDGTVYDPLRLGTIATGAWVRGEVVQGGGIRPPVSIEIKVQGTDLIADRIE